MLDPQWGQQGVSFAGPGNGDNNVIVALAQWRDKIVACGFSDASLTGFTGFAVARYRPNGTLDPSFGVGGVVITDLGSKAIPTTMGSYDAGVFGFGAALLVEGSAAFVGGTSDAPGQSSFAVAKYLLNQGKAGHDDDDDDDNGHHQGKAGHDDDDDSGHHQGKAGHHDDDDDD
jgi:hypothetical protein